MTKKEKILLHVALVLCGILMSVSSKHAEWVAFSIAAIASLVLFCILFWKYRDV